MLSLPDSVRRSVVQARLAIAILFLVLAWLVCDAGYDYAEYDRATREAGGAVDEELPGERFRDAASRVLMAALLALGSLLAFRATRRWQSTVTEGSRQLHQKTAELAQLNELLDRRVAQRTQELDDSVLATLNMMEDAVRDRENAEHAYAQLKLDELKLERIHGQLLEASRRAGMAEVATNVLHNVGNVLNSVNVSASLVMDRVNSSRADNMIDIVALLREHAPSLGDYITRDPKGRHIPDFLGQLALDWQEQRQLVMTELKSLRTNIDHINEIITLQQTDAKFPTSVEIAKISDLIEDSLRMNEASLVRHHVQVIREIEAVPPTGVEKHKVLQILVNLVRNAKDACMESANTDRRLTVRLSSADGRVSIAVVDNGVGIPAEIIPSIFSRGFTTRKDGHGFGLHSGAIAAAEMGGKLTAESEGAGCGATFTLDLPMTLTGTPP